MTKILLSESNASFPKIILKEDSTNEYPANIQKFIDSGDLNSAWDAIDDLGRSAKIIKRRSANDSGVTNVNAIKQTCDKYGVGCVENDNDIIITADANSKKDIDEVINELDQNKILPNNREVQYIDKPDSKEMKQHILTDYLDNHGFNKIIDSDTDETLYQIFDNAGFNEAENQLITFFNKAKDIPNMPKLNDGNLLSLNNAAANDYVNFSDQNAIVYKPSLYINNPGNNAYDVIKLYHKYSGVNESLNEQLLTEVKYNSAKDILKDKDYLISQDEGSGEIAAIINEIEKIVGNVKGWHSGNDPKDVAGAQQNELVTNFINRLNSIIKDVPDKNASVFMNDQGEVDTLNNIKTKLNQSGTNIRKIDDNNKANINNMTVDQLSAMLDKMNPETLAALKKLVNEK